jgi:uncharacterized MAPEG superfamily protein
MTTPFWCLFIATLLPIIISWVSGYFRQTQLGGIDNKRPREQNSRLEGAGARAVAAQSNAWEALIVFACAVFVSHLSGADAGNAATASVVFIVARVLHAVCYISDKDTLRSLSFIVGFGCCIWLFLMAA